MDQIEQKKTTRRKRMDYSNGKIYRLWSTESECFYVGSTVQLLCRRLHMHRHNDLADHSDIKIELIESFPCNTREELRAREGHFVRLYREKGFNLLNVNMPGRSKAEWREANRERLREKALARARADPEKHLESSKHYHLKNREKILPKMRERAAKRRKEAKEKKIALEVNREQEQT